MWDVDGGRPRRWRDPARRGACPSLCVRKSVLSASAGMVRMTATDGWAVSNDRSRTGRSRARKIDTHRCCTSKFSRSCPCWPPANVARAARCRDRKAFSDRSTARHARNVRAGVHSPSGTTPVATRSPSERAKRKRGRHDDEGGKPQGSLAPGLSVAVTQFHDSSSAITPIPDEVNGGPSPAPAAWLHLCWGGKGLVRSAPLLTRSFAIQRATIAVRNSGL